MRAAATVRVTVPTGHKSDAFRIVLCGRCGRVTCHDTKQCLPCKKRWGTGSEAVGAVVPYRPAALQDREKKKQPGRSFKLLLQEIAAMGIDVQLAVGPVDHH